MLAGYINTTVTQSAGHLQSGNTNPLADVFVTLKTRRMMCRHGTAWYGTNYPGSSRDTGSRGIFKTVPSKTRLIGNLSKIDVSIKVKCCDNCMLLQICSLIV